MQSQNNQLGHGRYFQEPYCIACTSLRSSYPFAFPGRHTYRFPCLLFQTPSQFCLQFLCSCHLSTIILYGGFSYSSCNWRPISSSYFPAALRNEPLPNPSACGPSPWLGLHFYVTSEPPLSSLLCTQSSAHLYLPSLLACID